MPPPTGTVTLLFTDIEGSTRRWEAHTAAMHTALARHDALLRGAIEEQSGYVFKTVGDAFYATFATAPQALEAALAAQWACHAEEWGEGGSLRVRMALHTGAVEAREGDYFGPPLNRVARLLSAGHGGQVLLSLATQELVRDYLPTGVALHDLGEHRLKDLIRPERVFQILAPGLPADFPLLRSLDNLPHNLPLQPTPLIGREREVEAVRERLLRPETRLVTLTGTGGTGKTRLGLQVAAELLEDFADGGFFVPLAPLSDPGLVPSTVAGTLGVMEAGGTPLLETLKQHLRDKQLLLVLDNFEQLLEAAPVVGDLLAAAPRLKVLATSRSALHLYGEHEMAVPPLSLPDPKKLPPFETLGQYEAVRLFIERAQAAKADFAITNANAPAVAAICHRLDGLPLAIELAAARIKLLPPQAMLTRLESRLKVLTGGAKNLPNRQQTLRGAIDWSYSLLEPGEQTLFARLSVFMGGRTLEAIEAVCNAEGDLGIDVLDGVESLLNKSLLRQDEVDGEPRFVMLETIHEYASEKLDASGEAESVKRDHIEFFLALTEEAEPQLKGSEQAAWLERLETEHDNFRVALRWAEENHETDMALRLAGSLWRFWIIRGPYSEGREWLAGALARAGTAYTAARAKALRGAAGLAASQGDYTSARPLTEENLAVYQELGDKEGISAALYNLGMIVAEQGDYGSARAFCEQSLEMDREQGDKWGIALSLNILGGLAADQGDYASARPLYEEALEIDRELGDKYGIAAVLFNLGEAAYLQGDYAAARLLLREALPIAREIGFKGLVPGCLQNFAALAVAEGKPEQAARLYGAAEALREAIGAPLLPSNRPRYEQDVAAARAQVDEAIFTTAWTEGRRMSAEEAVAYALAFDPPA